MLIVSRASDLAELAESMPGSVFAYPTETFYGLGCKISDIKAIERIMKIKGRDAAKGMIVLASGMPQVKSLAVMSIAQQALLEHFWPGPLSVLLKAQDCIDARICPEEKIALRVSSNETALEVSRLMGPVISTSANPSGMAPAVCLEELERYRLSIDAILDCGKTPGGLPSTLIDLTGQKPVCLRHGAVPFENVLKRWESLGHSNA